MVAAADHLMFFLFFFHLLPLVLIRKLFSKCLAGINFFLFCLLFFFVWLEMQQRDRHVSTRSETELRNALCDSCRNRFEMLRSGCCLTGKALSFCSLTGVVLALSQSRVCHLGGSMNNSCSFQQTQPPIDLNFPFQV